MMFVWKCPLCHHDNKQDTEGIYTQNEIEYCDDAQDNGCGEGPFMVRVILKSEVFLIQGQNYADMGRDVPLTTLAQLREIQEGIQEWNDGPSMSPAGLYHYMGQLDDLIRGLEQ